MLRYFRQNTDENHAVTVAQIIEHLASKGISAERKSIYDDIEALRLFGVDIETVRGKSTGYYLASREFELPELKLLVDSVQSSKFITQRKTLELIRKIEGLASKHDAALLRRQVFVANRVKTMNSSVYYNIDDISSAINSDRRIRFKYYRYTAGKQMEFRRDGNDYEVSPYALIWDDEYYYLLAYDSSAGMFKHYRVDKMKSISVLSSPREGKELFNGIDLSAYSSKVFGMFSGEEKRVRIRFAEELAGSVIDRFGRDVALIPGNDGSFIASVAAVVSPRFYAWLAGFGDRAEILSPPEVRAGMRRMMGSILKLYGGEESNNIDE